MDDRWYHGGRITHRHAPTWLSGEPTGTGCTVASVTAEVRTALAGLSFDAIRSPVTCTVHRENRRKFDTHGEKTRLDFAG